MSYTNTTLPQSTTSLLGFSSARACLESSVICGEDSDDQVSQKDSQKVKSHD